MKKSSGINSDNEASEHKAPHNISDSNQASNFIPPQHLAGFAHWQSILAYRACVSATNHVMLTLATVNLSYLSLNRYRDNPVSSAALSLSIIFSLSALINTMKTKQREKYTNYELNQFFNHHPQQAQLLRRVYQSMQRNQNTTFGATTRVGLKLFSIINAPLRLTYHIADTVLSSVYHFAFSKNSTLQGKKP